jgi:hypothetical protein
MLFWEGPGLENKDKLCPFKPCMGYGVVTSWKWPDPLEGMTVGLHQS